jgi:hypothetical protein
MICALQLAQLQDAVRGPMPDFAILQEFECCT